MQTSDGGYAVVINGNNMPGSRLVGSFLIKTDVAGNELWDHGGNGYPPNVATVVSVLESNDAGLVLGGNYFYYGPGGIFLNKVDLLGNSIWSTTFQNQSAACIVETYDGGLMIGGKDNDGSALLIKTNSAGNQIWNKTYGNFTINGVVKTSDSGYALAGSNILLKIDTFGNEQWNQKYSGRSLVQTSDGGYLFAQGNILVRTDSLGNIEWKQAFGASVNSIIKISSQDYVLAGSYPSNSGVNCTAWLAKISILSTMPSPTPTPTLPLADNFANLDAWTILDGTWVLTTSGVQGSSSAEALIYAGSSSWTDYQITAPVTISAGGEASIVFRFTDSNNFYWAGIGCYEHQYSICKVAGGTYSEMIGSGDASSNGAGTYALKLVAQGSTITLYVNNVLALTTTDSTFVSGEIGFRTFDSTMQVGNLSVSVPTPTPTLPFTDNFANLNAWTIEDGTWTLINNGVQGASSAEALMYSWSTASNILKDVRDAKAELTADGHNGPFDLCVRSDMDADIDGLIANTGISARDKLLGPAGILKGGQIFVSDNIFTSAGATTSALLVETSPMNFVLGVGQEVSVYNFQDEDMNTKGKVWEIVTPFIKRPTTICEITAITV